ncbi:hypothetical protein Tco_1345614 [Tanacetum coccineum]
MVRGFEQTKECYLTKVIPFFKTLKEHFEGIQKALTKEIKEMKEIFKELEAEVDQNVVNRKYDEIERKNILIANDNLIADCLSKEVFHIATNSKLTVSRFTQMHDAHTVVQARCLELEAKLSKLHAKVQKDDHTELVKHFSNLEMFRAENEKVKQHYKELYNSIKITRAKHIEQTTALLTENANLKVQIEDKMKCVTMDSVKPKVLAPETLREIVEEARLETPLDRSLAFACLYTKQSQELLEYAIGACPKDFNKQDNKHATTSLNRKKRVNFEDQCETSNNNIQKQVEQLNIQKTNVPVITFTRINACTDASGSQSRSNTKKNRISPANSDNKKQVEDHHRTNKTSRKKSNRVNSSISSKRAVINLNSCSVCTTCNKWFIFANHDMCVVNYLTFVNASPSVKNVVSKIKKAWQPKQIKQVKQVWKATGKLLTNVGYQWKPTGRKFTLGEQCLLTRLTKSKVVAPTNIGDPTLQTLHLHLFSNAGRTYCPLVFGLGLLKPYDEGSLTAQEFREKVHRDS